MLQILNPKVRNLLRLADFVENYEDFNMGDFNHCLAGCYKRMTDARFKYVFSNDGMDALASACHKDTGIPLSLLQMGGPFRFLRDRKYWAGYCRDLAREIAYA